MAKPVRDVLQALEISIDQMELFRLGVFIALGCEIVFNS